MNKLLSYLEKVFLVALVVAYALQIVGSALPILMTLSLSALGLTFFLSAYKAIDIETQEGEQMGFNELLGLFILPKVLWISTSVGTIGILFYSLQLGNDGYLKMFYVSGLSISIATVILLILKTIGTKYLTVIFPIYFRALPTLLVIAYILFG